MKRLTALVGLLALTSCDGSTGDDAGTPPTDAPPLADVLVIPDTGPPDAGPVPGTLDVVVEGVPPGAVAWIAVTTNGTSSRWIRESGRLALEPGPVVIAAAPIDVAGTSYAPTPTLEELDLSATAGSVTITYAPAPTDFFATDPDFATCTAGAATELSRERAMAMLHFVRALVGVPPVDYDTASEAAVRDAAIVYANSDSPDPHDPPSDATCYTADANAASGDSNLRWVGSSNPANVEDETPESFVRFWGTDRGVRSLGHRRWIIDPFLPRASFAMTVGEVQPGPYQRAFTYIAASAMKVIYDDQASLSGWSVDTLAYPVGEFPAALIDIDEFPYLSFSVMADPSGRWGANQDDVDFAGATVAMRDSTGSDLAVSDVDHDNRGVGLPNQISWRADGLVVGETYTVTITGVSVLGADQDYEYTFTLL